MIETVRQGLEAEGFKVPMTRLCRWFEVPRRTVYYRPTKAAPKVQEQIVVPIKAMIEENPSFGYRTVAGLLGMNKNTVQRIFQIKGRQVRRRPVGFRPRVKCIPSIASQPNERWVTDLCLVWCQRHPNNPQLRKTGMPLTSKSASSAIAGETAGGEIVVSSISAWEIAMLVARERLTLQMDVDRWLKTVGQIEAVRFAPVDVEIAAKSVALPGEFHADPADRMIVATARSLAAPLVTKDARIRNYAHVKSIW